MTRLILSTVITAVSLLVVAHVVPGFHVAGFVAALVTAVVIGLINATLGLFVKIVTAPLSIITFGGFLLVVNALMLMLASSLLRGFQVSGFGAALVGGIVLSLVNLGLRWMVRRSQRRD